MSLFPDTPGNLNNEGSGREICVFLLDNYIVDYCVCATVTILRSLLQWACMFCSALAVKRELTMEEEKKRRSSSMTRCQKPHKTQDSKKII